MKRVGIVTFHRSASYGACLQAYATCWFIRSLGCEAEMVDYTNKQEQKFHRWSYKENGKVSGYVTSLIKNVLFGKKIYADRIYGNPERYYPLSPKRYTQKEQMQGLHYDVLVAGSDQIWSPAITKEIDDVYLLQFGTADRRISVASSLGSVVLSEEEHAVFKRALKTFAAVSVREPFAKKQLEQDTDKEISILLDPTFLLDQNEWVEQLARKSIYYHTKEKYILTFFVAPQPDYRQRVQGYADKMQLPVWSIQSIRIKRVNSSKVIVNAKMEDFLALVKNAALVVTDSFHGAALSVNLNTDFVAFQNTGNPVRVKTLMGELGIPERVDLAPADYRPIQYEKVNEILEPLREETRNWVKNALEI